MSLVTNLFAPKKDKVAKTKKVSNKGKENESK